MGKQDATCCGDLKCVNPVSVCKESILKGKMRQIDRLPHSTSQNMANSIREAQWVGDSRKAHGGLRRIMRRPFADGGSPDHSLLTEHYSGQSPGLYKGPATVDIKMPSEARTDKNHCCLPWRTSRLDTRLCVSFILMIFRQGIIIILTILFLFLFFIEV